MSQGHVVLGNQGSAVLPYQATWSATVTDQTPYRYIAFLKTDGGYAFVTELRAFASSTSPAKSLPTPYGGSPVTVAANGTTKVEAENYDLGGEGVAYHDVDNGGSTLYRSDNVGIDPVASASNGYGVGSTAGGEWDGYTLSIASAGTYTLSAAVSSPSPGGTFHLEFGPVAQIGGAGVTQSGEFTVPNTGSYTAFQTISVPGVSLPAGKIWMRLVLDSAYPCIFDYFTLSSASTGPAAPTGLTATAGDGSAALSWTAPSGSGLTYNIKRATVSGGPYTVVSTFGAVTTTTYADSGLTTGTPYYYVVSAVSGAGEGSNSNEASATPSMTSSDFSITASPACLSVSPTANASTTLTITPGSAFSGNVSLALTALPDGITSSLTPSSSVSVTAGTATSTSVTFAANSSAAGTYNLMLTATSGTLSYSVPLVLTVAPTLASVQHLTLTDLFLPLQALIQWPAGGHQSNLYTVSRNGATAYTAGSLYWYDTTIQVGTTYLYHVTNAWADAPYYDNTLKQEVYPHGTDDLGTISVTPEQVFVSDNQSVDARYDLRYATWTFLDHNFGTTTYHGGLFAGYNADNSQVGHAYLKFALPATPAGKTLWPISSVNAYFTQCYAAGSATVACQTVSSAWTGGTSPGTPLRPSPRRTPPRRAVSSTTG